MATKGYFRNFDSLAEQRLVEDLICEAIAHFGIDLWYIRRKSTNRGTIIQEDKMSVFDAAFLCEMFIKSTEGFEGEGDFLSKFGLEIRDRMMLTVARRAFKDHITTKSAKHVRPMEGDLIFFPLNRKFFEIKFVEHEAVFYQMGSLQTFDLTCELYEFNNETFQTGLPLIDDIYTYKMNTNLLETGPSAINGPTVEPYTSADGSVIEPVSVDDETNDPLAFNTAVQAEGNTTIDWTETDPFSEGGRY